jgi:two-component system osmolarity sensor histidine kinase EnvZ
VRLSLFWRTFALIVGVIAVSLLAWLQLFRAAELQPRAERFAWEVASVVNLTRAGLLSAAGEARLELLDELAREEGIRVLPAEPTDRVEPWAEERFGRLAEAKLRELLGPEARLAARVDDDAGLWIRFAIDDDLYWMRLDPARLERQANRNWLGWIGIAMALAVAGALAISRVVNRPLSNLAGAIDRLSRGDAPAPLREAGPTELAEVNRRFNRLAGDLVALERDRAEALAGISHDIRTPLARLRLEIEVAPVDEPIRASMAEEIERIDAIVRQFVEFARPVDPGRTQEVDVPATVAAVLDAFRHGPDRDRLAIRVTAAEGLRWRGDPLVLERILSNLVENARRYGGGPDGRVRVDVDARRTARGIELQVRDHGPGVPEAQFDRLLRPFTRLDTERNRHGGAGLGLAIVDRLAHQHGGALALQAAEGGGLLARVTLADDTAGGR